MSVLAQVMIVVACLGMPTTALSAAQPNVLFIAVDDMNDWGIGGHSQAITPHIDALAARGITFTNAHSAGIKCGPSRAAIFTGQYPTTTGFYDDHIYWQDGENNPNTAFIGLHAAFDNAGYTTLGTGKLFHHAVGWIDRRNWDQFWLRTDEASGEQRNNFWDIGSWKYDAPHPGGPKGELVSIYNTTFPKTKAGVMEWWPLDNAVEAEMADTKRADWVISQLQADHGDTPFFLGLGLYSPHSPHYAPQKYYDAYLDGPLNGDLNNLQLPAYWEDGSTNPVPDLADINRKVTTKESWIYERWMAKLKTIGPDERGLKECILGYLAAITYADAQIGRVLNALESSPYADNTIVVLWSDHGYHLGEKGHWAKHVMWERGTQVPFVWAGPGIAQGGTTDSTVSLIDMYPTLVELCGLTENGINATLQALDGTSLVPALKDPSQAEDREVLISNLQANAYAVTNKNWRYIYYDDGSEELYDHHNDPHEWYNLADDPAYQSVRLHMRSKGPVDRADYALRYLQNGVRSNDEGTWYFSDHAVKVDVTLSSNAADVVSGAFEVSAWFTTDVEGFSAEGIHLTNASLENFQKIAPDRYTFNVVPDAAASGQRILVEAVKNSALGVPNNKKAPRDHVTLARRYHPNAESLMAPAASPAVASMNGSTVHFDSGDSSDGDGSVEACLWQFGDGMVSTDRSPSYTYTEPGTYQVTLGVTDNDGLGSALKTITVTVGEQLQ